ncbi:MAG: peptidoglycan DD-metalloendopeptidase family protein [Comamonadaceae bacterium]|nr:peptidoglycan DD-metalloendopeptidase family protein [Comamonadaceae bacterium]
MSLLIRRPGLLLLAVVTASMLGACSSRSLNRAPVEDRPARPTSPIVAAVPSPPGNTTPTTTDLAPLKLPQGAENAGKPGYYTVKPGDTLLRISLENGQSMQDVARWNHIENPNRIEVGQVLRVAPPGSTEVVVKPIAKPALTASSAAVAASSTTAPVSATSSTASAVKPAVGETEINWIWPAGGVVLAGFDDVKNKGLDIGGTAGEPVLAAADGRVVYVGAGLRGYGNLIILKHDNVYLTAYAHNQTLLVKEDQSVVKGQKIAEMGNSDADRVKLHFEVRRQGKPVDPAKYLPAR